MRIKNPGEKNVTSCEDFPGVPSPIRWERVRVGIVQAPPRPPPSPLAQLFRKTRGRGGDHEMICLRRGTLILPLIDLTKKSRPNT
jgi:hypothetical protein